MSARPRPGALYDDYLGTLPFWQGVKEAPPLAVILTGDDDAYDAWVVERWKQQYAAASDPSQTSASVDVEPHPSRVESSAQSAATDAGRAADATGPSSPTAFRPDQT